MVAAWYFMAALGGLGCAAAAATPSSCTFESIAASSELKWCSCGTNFSCAKLKVPLDYKNPSLGQAIVPLKKYAAAAKSPDGPYQGMLTVIPGGPGGSGVDLVTSDASTFQSVVGSNWDIVSFDPRGIYRSEPALDCAVSASSAATNNSRRDAVPRLTDDFYQSFIRFGKEVGDRCAQRSGGASDAGPHMSTAVVARDLLSIADAFARTADGRRAAANSRLLHFYAVSYGTVVAQTFASMFPKRVGRAVLDGLVRPETYLAGWTEESINHLDGVLALFFVYCNKAGPKLCPYATGSSSRDTFARFKASFARLDARKAEAEHWKNATDIAEALLTLKSTAFNAAYFPLDTFANFSQVLIDLETALHSGSLKQWTQQTIAATRDPGPAGQTDTQFVLGVACSDESNLYYGQTLKDLQPRIQTLEDQSILGEIWMTNALLCTGWKIKPVDVFKGPFGGDTATPMLFVSNTYDPVTPIENSRFGAPKYTNAQILTIDGLGHVSTSANNTCAFAKVRAYYQTAQLPGYGNVCATESGPFGVTLNGTLQKSIQEAGLSDLHFR